MKKVVLFLLVCFVLAISSCKKDHPELQKDSGYKQLVVEKQQVQ